MHVHSRRVLSGAIGFLIGLAVWFGFSGPYAGVVAAMSQATIGVFERPRVTRIDTEGSLMVIHRSDVAPSEMRPAVESTDITFNFILLITLFAVNPRALARRNLAGFAAAAAVLLLIHVAATISFVQMFYVDSLAGGGYGRIARWFWGSAPYFYGIIGVYGSAVALWWLFRPVEVPAARLSRSGRRLPTSQNVPG